MARESRQHVHLVRRTLVPLLIVALPIAAMVAFILYSKHPDRPAAVETPSAPAVFGQDRWPIFRGDTALTGRAAGALPAALTLAWTFETEDAVKSTPVIADGLAYISSTDGRLYAVDLQTGAERWRLETEAAFEAGGLYHDEKLYLGNEDGVFYAVDAHNGQIVWSREIGGKITGTANLAVLPESGAAMLVIGSYDNHLYGFDAETGAVLLNYAAQNYINGAVAVADGKAIFGSCDANLYVVPVASPNDAQTIDAGSYVAANPAIDGGVVFAGSFEGRFLAADMTTQKVLWTFDETPEAFFSSPAVHDQVVVVGNRDGTVYCLDRATGDKRWAFSAQDGFDSSPVICGDTVAIGCDDGRLYLLDIQTGEEVFSYTLGSPVVSSPAVAENHLLIGCDNGMVYAFVEKR
jgi:outer membrane protein assembly factor BamB